MNEMGQDNIAENRSKSFGEHVGSAAEASQADACGGGSGAARRAPARCPDGFVPGTHT
jgi:hypothetical protein